VNNKQILLDPLFEPVLFEAFLCSGLCEFEPAASCSFRAVLGLFLAKNALVKIVVKIGAKIRICAQ